MTDLIKILIIAGSLATVGVIKYYYPAYRDDNPIEEAAEAVIKYETGVDVDLTPLSPTK
jgi:hypothetical protein